MPTLKKTLTKKSKRTTYWVDFASDKRHQRKFQLFEDACEYIYHHWFVYKINTRSVMNDAVFFNASFDEMILCFIGYNAYKYRNKEISYNTLCTYKKLRHAHVNERLYNVNAVMLNHFERPTKVALKTFFNWLIEHQVISINPIKIEKYSKSLPYFASEDDYIRIINCKEVSELDKLAVYLAKQTGARISEIVTLRIENITDNTISFVSHESKGVEKRGTKTNIGRTIRVNKKVTDEIKKHYIPNKNQWIFWDGKKRRTSDAIRQKTSKYCNFGKFHGFRHAAIGKWVDKGVDVYKVSKAAGHSSVEYTFKAYGHVINNNEELPVL